MRFLAPLIVLVLLGVASASQPVSAQPYGPGPYGPQPYGPRERVQSGQVRSLGEILDYVRRQRPGNLADVQGPNIGPGGEPHYRLKWVSPNGRVEWLDTDARTGRILGTQIPGGGPGPIIVPNGIPNGGGPRGFGPRRQNFGPPVVVPSGPGPGYRPRPGYGGRGPGGSGPRSRRDR
jgi:hypothetical protein